MNENKLGNIMLCSMVILSVIMFSWTCLYINQVASNIQNNAPVVSAFDA